MKRVIPPQEESTTQAGRHVEESTEVDASEMHLPFTNISKELKKI